MKKIVTILLTAFLFATAGKAQYVTIPDANFRNFLETKYPSCFNSAHEMDTTCSGMVNAVSINCNYKGIANLDGLQYFKSLQNFSCSNNSLSSLPNLSSTITYIECNNNQILGLPALPSGLQVLKCGFNQITALPALPNTLITLECNINQLTTMPTLPNGITKINCNYNQINALPSLPSNIYDFDCSNNQLTSLPTLPNSLLNLYCDNNSLTSLPTLPNGLATLYCSANQLVSLPALPNTINTLFCAINKLASLPTLPSSLGNFDCSNNLLTSLPTLPSNIYTFFCYSNNIQCLPILPSTINLLRFDSAKIACIPNIPKPATLIYNAYWGNTFTPLVCNTINNPNNCTVLSNPFVNIPDTSFGKFLLTQYPSCLYKDVNNMYWMDTTCSGVVNADSIVYIGWSLPNNEKIQDLIGVQYFKNLKYLDVTKNLLSNLTLLPSTLKYLNTNFNTNIAALPTLPSSLTTLNCYQNSLTALPQLPNTLQNIDVLGNNLSVLPTLPDSLLYLRTYGNPLLQCLPILPSHLASLYTDVPCILNKPATLLNAGGSAAPPPVCNSTNNPNNCSIYNPYVNIPDSNFGNFLIAQYPTCLYKDAANKYWMDTTCSGVENETSMSCSNKNISSIDGIKYFKNLTTLYTVQNNIDSIFDLPNSIKILSFERNNIKFIDHLPDSLTGLTCINNKLSSLPNIPINLKYIEGQENNLTTLPTLNNVITMLGLSINKITSLPALPNSLTALFVDSNLLQCLPVLPNSLTTLFFAKNKITCLPNIPSGLTTTLPLCNSTNNPNNCTAFGTSANYVNIPDTSFGKFLIAQYPTCLYKDVSNLYWMDTTCSGVVNETTLSCVGQNINSIQGVVYFKNLVSLFCEYNPIDFLPQLPQTLKNLSCRNTLIKQLINLPALLEKVNASYTGGLLQTIQNPLPKNLIELVLGSNMVTTLPDLPITLTLLSCGYNPINCLPKLPASLNILELGGTFISCLPNLPNNCAVIDAVTKNPINYPICSPSNNSNQCKSFPVVYGKVFTDNNSNGVKDANEFYRPFIKVSLNTGETVYTNLNGEFAISTDSVGSYTLKTTTPALFAAIPDSNNFSFSQYNTSLTLADIALQPTVIKDSFVIAATAYNNRPRPGFNYTYNVGYANVGTVNAAANNIIHFNFDSSRLVFDSASVPVQSIINGNVILVDAGALYAGQWGTFNLYFTVKTTAILGDSLKAGAQITYSTTKAYTYYVAAIVGSFDPNDKQATPELTPTQVTNGEYIEYTVRFQNTGTDTAINVVIADTLSPLLQANILKIIGQSHNVKISIANGIIYFEFLNIYLPDSNINKKMSNGFIKFQLKPINSVALGSVIPNTASIYFDYNLPIVTNTVSTIIKVSTVPVKIISYTLTNKKQETRILVLNNWMVGVETNVSHYVIQRSFNGKDFSTVGKIGASNSSRYSFTDDGLPLTVNSGPLTLYYRIQIIDRDGSYIYSEVRSINLNEKQEIRSVVLYPNPAKDIVTIETVDGKALMIIDYLGKTVLSKSIINHQQSIINVQGFSKGLYLVKLLMNNGEIRTAKLVIE